MYRIQMDKFMDRYINILMEGLIVGKMEYQIDSLIYTDEKKIFIN